MDSFFEGLPPENREVYQKLHEFFKENFKSPAEFLAFYDKQLRDNEYNLYSWQSKIHREYLAQDYTSQNPLELVLVAVNGSGKDKMVIAPFVPWFMLTNVMSTIITTSSSSAQLNNQTEKYIRMLCNAVNVYHGIEIFDIKQRNIKCHITGAEIFLFATDDAGKAEGYHQVQFGRKFAIIKNESKSIDDKIDEALNRCNGFTHWIEVSSPGKPDGAFYRKAHSTRPQVKVIKVLADDCPHLGGENYKERLKEVCGGESNHVYQSMVWAQFGSTDEQVVLAFEKYERCMKFPPEWNDQFAKPVAGLDLSGGGDEQSLYIRVGNKVIASHQWRIKDATVLVEELIKKFLQYNLRGSIINADAGGLGIVIIQMLWKRGWREVKAIYNNSESTNQFAYFNNGTEMWFNLASLIENQEICFTSNIRQDPTLKSQLCNRYYILKNSGNTTVSLLESKQQARAKGHPSPDRADSLALCFLKYKTPKQFKEKNEKLKQLAETIKQNGAVKTIRDFIKSSIGHNEWDNAIRKSGIVNATGRLTNESRFEKQLGQLKINQK